jgi:hypothetical protein
MNRPARFTVADLRRALKAAQHSGPEYAVEIAVDGTIRIVRTAAPGKPRPISIEAEDEIVL